MSKCICTYIPGSSFACVFSAFSEIIAYYNSGSFHKSAAVFCFECIWHSSQCFEAAHWPISLRSFQIHPQKFLNLVSGTWTAHHMTCLTYIVDAWYNIYIYVLCYGIQYRIFECYFINLLNLTSDFLRIVIMAYGQNTPIFLWLLPMKWLGAP